MQLMKTLRTDKELIAMRKEWESKMSTRFPPYNYDEYGGIDDYKEKIRRMMVFSNLPLD